MLLSAYNHQTSRIIKKEDEMDVEVNTLLIEKKKDS